MRLSLLASVAGAAFAGFVGAAQAADIVAPVPEANVWTGFYIGAHIGYGEAYMDGCVECNAESVSKAEKLDLNGVIGGLHAGYNFQSDNIVFGIEGDIDFTDWHDKGKTTEDDEWQKGSVDTLGSVRGRLGIASDDSLFYVTGGIALSDAEWISDRDSDKDTAHFNDVGGVVGAGIEHMVFSNVSLR